MPSGRTHLKIEAVLLFAWTALGGILLANGVASPQALVSFILAYAFSMLFLSPDLDLARSRASKRWGIARVLWMPYALVFRHRGRSHHPVFGALTRILYLLLLVVVVVVTIVALSGTRISIHLPPGDVMIAVVAGLYVPNLTHIVADRLVSDWKAKQARRRL